MKQALFIIAALISTMGTASAMMTDTVVHNHTDKYLWVDISWAYKVTGWKIDTAYCLRPGAVSGYHAIEFRSPELGPQIRVRAEVKNAKDCGGGNIDVAREQINVPTTIVNGNPRLQAIVEPSGGGYHMNLSVIGF